MNNRPRHPARLVVKRFLFITAAIYIAVSFILAPAASGSGAIIGISAKPVKVDFGSILPGGNAIGLDLTIYNTGGADIVVTSEITNDTAGFYAEYLYLEGMTAATWGDTISSGGSIVITPELIGLPTATEPGSYSCTVIFWAEATP
jgi:hypothetical protein